METKDAGRRFLMVVLVGAAILVAMSFFPLAGALILATALAAMFWPLNMRLSRKLGQKRGRTAAAAIITGTVVVIVLGPVIGLSTFLLTEAKQGLDFIAKTAKSEGVDGLIGRLPDPIEKVARDLIERFVGRIGADDEELGEALQDKVTEQSGKAAGAVGAAVSATGSLLFQAAMMVIAFYCLLREGERLVLWLDRISPLPEGQTVELLSAVQKVSSSVLKSTLLTSAAQATVALVGYLIARVPYPVFFTALTFVIAFIPAVGAGAVCLLAAALVLVTGHPYMALFLAIWALGPVALIDNLLKPILIKGEAELNGAITFFALLGGLAAFGAIGLLIGPLAVALLVEVIRMYRGDLVLRSD